MPRSRLARRTPDNRSFLGIDFEKAFRTILQQQSKFLAHFANRSILRSLAPSPANRFATVKELAKQLS